MVIICCHLCVYVQSNLYFDCHAALPVLYVGKILIMKRISVFQSKIEAMLMINQMSYLITTLSWIKHPLQGGQNKTQLFYEGIQQFGTDLSMIQQLFPGQTRHQIKLKFKETQHALRLSEALSSRTKDNIVLSIRHDELCKPIISPAPSTHSKRWEHKCTSVRQLWLILGFVLQQLTIFKLFAINVAFKCCCDLSFSCRSFIL
ncbi:uncharacterized protein LOC110612905 isoform X3 [Manihot esculenta]|uniref:Uncharacterized protein n=1 Tax=Manihot esculenta TaxID=3983 RepID=A0ACB7HTG6_MANES|nr:uncharacterized protein LOC110612905 isoform X3 [Manihot esculenta]KAG8655927.1 hypothetical protein MANES_04G075172v8 [Manihot esculenta]